MNMVQVFASHSRLDRQTCDRFDVIASRVGIRVVRSEYEGFKAPAWRTIKKEMANSKALFLLVGKELVRAQQERRENWAYTQNWIAYEVGLACALGIDVWVFCDNVKINFPVPYVNNYSTSGLGKSAMPFKKMVLTKYKEGESFPFGYKEEKKFCCPHNSCRAKFNFHTTVQPGKSSICPTCLRKLEFPKGWRV